MTNNVLGFPLVEIALAASVAGFCWAFSGMAAVALWHALARLRK